MVKGGHIICGVVLCLDEYGIPGVIKSRRMSWTGQLIHKSGKRNAYKILMEKHEGKRLLGRPRCTCEVDIKTNLEGIQW
jgi:hypothetical protein